MFIKMIGILFWICAFQLVAESPLTNKSHLIGFQDLKSESQWIDKSIQIKGFLSHDQDQWLISPEPHLKSCCMGIKEKVHQQIYLDINFNENWQNQLVEVKGVLQKNSLGQFVLRSASFIEQKNQGGWSIFFAFVMIGIIGALLAMIVRKSRV
ncbi:MAG: hypothetical protein BGO14_09400 [Chlamydiales bacterium 38-26]|nr:hypothetical protein [Chlamydiales bacterium]OJV11191.1 MAG: hypothetical protein BGO14_09400 [Chlamydiales bacterium 38-26]